jgi:aryl-alcohol dehydrogenase-like predicted oxidoreductase
LVDILKKAFTLEGPLVTRVGLGGEGVLRTHGRDDEARAVIETALEQGVAYFDTAVAYAGSQGYLGRIWKDRPNDRARVFHTSKSAGRSKKHALADLENTLRTLNTDYLDLWQVHDVRGMDELETIAGPNGALEAFVQARQAGKVRYIGVTGHHDPDVLTRAIDEWPVDAVLMPINPAESVIGGFLDQTLPRARKKGLAVIGMKSLGAGHYVRPSVGVTAESLLQFALAQDIDVLIVGCSTPDEVKLLAQCGAEPTAMTEQEQERLIEIFQPQAIRLAYYRGRA